MTHWKKNRYRRSLYGIVIDYLKFILLPTTTWLLVLVIMIEFNDITDTPISFNQLAMQAALGAWVFYMLIIFIACAESAGAGYLNAADRRWVIRLVIELTCLYGSIGLLTYDC